MIKTYKYKLYNNKTYENRFNRWCGVCRLVYNIAKETKECAYKEFGKSISKYDMIKQLPELKEEFEWIKEVNSQTLQAVIERLYKSFDKFFSGGGYPKWAKKFKYRSFRFKQGVKRTKKGFKLPKFGNVKVFNNEREIEGSIKGATMIRKADGLYIHIVTETKDSKLSENQASIGIDVGVSYFCTTSEGVHIENPRHLESKLKELRIEQRALARKKKGSNRRIRQIKKVRRLHKKVKDARLDFLHKVSTKLARRYSTIVVEDLNVEAMKRSRLSRQISDVSWSKFFELLEYKTKVVKVDPKYTSQTCPKCGNVSKENRTSQSSFKCTSCEHTANADVVGAKNIEARAFANSR